MKNILIIDDNESILKTYKWILKDEKYNVIEALSGKSGIKLFKNENIDLVITDIEMPEKNGIEVIIELKAIAPEVKIIVVSGGSSTGNFSSLKTASLLGADYCFTKPIRKQEFLEAVRVLLKQ
jgi:YesN/AraC family two-component response regulator